jgi:hypothetical protein
MQVGFCFPGVQMGLYQKTAGKTVLHPLAGNWIISSFQLQDLHATSRQSHASKQSNEYLGGLFKLGGADWIVMELAILVDLEIR